MKARRAFRGSSVFSWRLWWVSDEPTLPLAGRLESGPPRSRRSDRMEDEEMAPRKPVREENEPLCAIGSRTMADAVLRPVDALVSQSPPVAGAVRSTGGAA